jgi:electron transfer flavoprotein alpha/beta subunit
MSNINSEIEELEKQLSRTRNEPERASLIDKIQAKKKELANTKAKDVKKEFLVNKEAPARIDHNKVNRGDVVINDSSANIAL